MPPKVSINLCCYNGEKYLEETLQSIFLQTYTDWELVVVNDGSTDSTERIIKSHKAAGKPIVYHYQENAGLGSARNKALQLSSGSYIALIDQDDIWLSEKLEKQVRAFEVDRLLGLVYSDTYYIDQDGKELGTAFKRSPPPEGDLRWRGFWQNPAPSVHRPKGRSRGGATWPRSPGRPDAANRACPCQ